MRGDSYPKKQVAEAHGALRVARRRPRRFLNAGSCVPELLSQSLMRGLRCRRFARSRSRAAPPGTSTSAGCGGKSDEKWTKPWPPPAVPPAAGGGGGSEGEGEGSGGSAEAIAKR